MKNPVQYLKKNGIRHIFDVLYQYKIYTWLVKVMKPFYRNRPRQDMILIESHNDFDCNGGAFYDYLIKNGYNRNYRIVLFLKNEIPAHLPDNVEAVALHKPSVRKARRSLQAKYMLSDNDFLHKSYPDQTAVYCTHGSIGLKNCKGLIDVPDGIDYVLGSSPEMADIFEDQYNLPDADHQLIYIGYPMHDFLYHPELEGDLHKITSKKYKKTILWMPTFRKGGGFRRSDTTGEQPLGIPFFPDEESYQKMNDWLRKEDIHLILKLHPMQDLSDLKARSLSNITILTGKDVKKLGVDNYRLMHDVDALISDYSSAAYDFLPLNRPVAYTLDDAQDYKIGFIVDNPEDLMAGHKIYTFEDFQHFVDDIAQGKDPYKKEREALTRKIFSVHDGNSSQRLAEFLHLKKPES